MGENPVVSVATAEAALEKCLSAINAIDEKNVEPCFVAGAVMVEAARKISPLLAADRPAVEAAFAAAPMETMLSVEERALAAFAAEKRLVALDPKPVTDLPKLYVEGGKLKETSVKVLELLDGENPEVVRVVEKIRPGIGYRDRAEDLAALHPLLLARKDKVVATTLMTSADIDRVGELSPLLLDPKGGTTDAIKAARLLRNQAYTYFLEAYLEIRRHAAFVHFHAPLKFAAYPNIFARNTGGK